MLESSLWMDVSGMGWRHKSGVTRSPWSHVVRNAISQLTGKPHFCYTIKTHRWQRHPRDCVIWKRHIPAITFFFFILPSFEIKADLNGFNYFSSSCCPRMMRSFKYGQEIISKGTLNVCLWSKICINADHKKWTAKHFMELIPSGEGRSPQVHLHSL